MGNNEFREKIREILSSIPDIERSLSRLMLGSGSSKDINLLKIGLNKILKLSEFLHAVKSSENELEIIYKSLGDHKDMCEFLNKAILDNNVSKVKEGGFIDQNYNAELSELSYILKTVIS